MWFRGSVHACVSEKGAMSVFEDNTVSAVGIEWVSFGLFYLRVP